MNMTQKKIALIILILGHIGFWYAVQWRGVHPAPTNWLIYIFWTLATFAALPNKK